MRAQILAGGLFGALALVGCDDTLFIAHGGSDTVPTGSDYCSVQTVIANNCLDCHSAAAHLGDLDLESDLHTTVVDNVGYYGVTLVVPEDPEGSLLYQKTTDTQPSDGSLGGVMPTGSAGLSAAENQVIYDWIAAGASIECSDTGTTDDTGTTGGTDDTGTGGTTDTGPVDASWSEVLSLFDAQCNYCHNAAGAKSFSYLDLETDPYNAIVGAWSAQWSDQILVVAGVPEESLLYRKCVNDIPSDLSLGGSMPQSGTVSKADGELLYNWIKNGATQD